MESSTIRNFAPSWFAAVMGTGILAMTGLQHANALPILGPVSIVLTYFNIALFFILLVPWSLRWIFFRKEALSDFRHPIQSNFYPTMTISIVLMSAHFGVLGHPLWAYYTWWIGALGTVIFSVLIPLEMFKSEEIAIDHISPAWFIPPVSLIVIPLVGGNFIPQTTGIEQELVILINYFGFGSGFLLYIALLAICLYRFIVHHPLPNVLAPTIWISLGPVGAGAIALINVVGGSAFVTTKEPFFVMGFLLWTFGIWWLFIAIGLTVHYLRRLQLPYAMTWWAFIFPLGAFVAGSHAVSLSLGISIVEVVGFILYWLLLILWIITIVKGVVSSMHPKKAT